MSRPECRRELEVLGAAESGATPDPESDLGRHFLECGVCVDLFEVARAIRDDRRLVEGEARLQPGAVVWWRSQLRARREAAERVNRPITALQAFAAACSVGVVLALGGVLVPPARQWFRDLPASVASSMPSVLGDLGGFSLVQSPLQTLLVLALAAVLLALPVVLYLILSDR
jgi:hypothetical protein